MNSRCEFDVVKSLKPIFKAVDIDLEKPGVIAQVAGDVCAGPSHAPAVVVSARDQHAVSTEAKAVKLIDHVAVLGNPSGTSENADPDGGQFFAPGIISVFLDPKKLIKIDDSGIVARLFINRYDADDFSNQMTRVDVVVCDILVALTDESHIMPGQSAAAESR